MLGTTFHKHPKSRIIGFETKYILMIVYCEKHFVYNEIVAYHQLILLDQMCLSTIYVDLFVHF